MPNGNGDKTRVWVMGGTLTAVVGALVFIVQMNLSNANDTLKNAATKTDVEKAITSHAKEVENKYPTISELPSYIDAYSPYREDKAKLVGVCEDVNELKVDFKEYKAEQTQNWKDFNQKQDETMKLLIKLNAQMEQKNK